MALALGLTFFATAGTVAADRLKLTGDMVQGGLVQGKTEPGARVRFADRNVRLTADGVFLIGFGRDDGPEARLEVTFPDGRRETRTLKVRKRQYEIQRIDGLPQRKVTPKAEDLKRIRAENARIAAVRARDTATPFFRKGFVWPAIGPISGVYGSQRILNGEPRRPHFGIDVAAPVGAPVWAPSDGLVALVQEDMFYTGGTVMIDHGHGLTSVFSHLSKVAARQGQRVRQGDKIGEVGATGRATGAHLDWRINLFATRLDPQLLVGPMPRAKAGSGPESAGIGTGGR